MDRRTRRQARGVVKLGEHVEQFRRMEVQLRLARATLCALCVRRERRLRVLILDRLATALGIPVGRVADRVRCAVAMLAADEAARARNDAVDSRLGDRR